MVGPVEVKPPPETERDHSPNDFEQAAPTPIAAEPPLTGHDPYRISSTTLGPMSLLKRAYWQVVDVLLRILFRSIDWAASVWRRFAADSGRGRRLVDAAHPTWAEHTFKRSGNIQAEYWIFVPVESPAELERAADLVLRHLRDWRSFYRRSHIEYLGPEPDPCANTPVTFKFAPFAPLGKKYTGREVTLVTVSFARRERLPDGSGWVVKGALIDGHDESGQRLPHEFTGPVQTEVRVIDEPAQGDRPARFGIEVRDIWVDVKNHKPISDFVATKMHLFRSSDGFGGLRKFVAKELKDS